MAGLILLDVALGVIGLYLLRTFIRPCGLPLPPGPKRKPIIGNLLDLPQSFDWLHWATYKDLYGPLLLASFGLVGLTLVCRPNLVRVDIRKEHYYLERCQGCIQSPREKVLALLQPPHLPHGRRDVRSIFLPNSAPCQLIDGRSGSQMWLGERALHAIIRRPLPLLPQEHLPADGLQECDRAVRDVAADRVTPLLVEMSGYAGAPARSCANVSCFLSLSYGACVGPVMQLGGSDHSENLPWVYDRD